MLLYYAHTFKSEFDEMVKDKDVDVDLAPACEY
jgi:hypothetical protein